MELAIKNSADSLTVSENAFGRDFNEALVHQVVVAYNLGSHQGSRAQKSRSEVAGSGKKPWRQKGTGRARSGSLRSPLWRKGGVTFAAKPQSCGCKVNKKMYRGALRSIFSELVRQDRIVVVENFYVDVPKTKFLIKKLNEMSLENVLIITEVVDTNLRLAARNLYKVGVHSVSSINPISLITFDKVIITIQAIKKIEEMLR